ncbi:hypothetical protein Tco_1438632 [Tanacetum coccineum]
MNYYKPNPCYDSNYSGLDQIEPPQFPVIHQPPQEISIEALLAREDRMKSIENFLKKFNRISFRETPKVLMYEHLRQLFRHVETVKVIKLGVEILVPSQESQRGIPDKMCDVPFHDNSPPLDISKDQFEDFSDSNDDSTLLVRLFSLIDRLREWRVHFLLGFIFPNYEAFVCDSEPDSGDFTMDVVEDISFNPTREPRVHVPNTLPTHPTLHLDFILSSDSLFAYVVWNFLPFLTYLVSPPYLLSCGNEDTIFDPGISIYHSFMPSVSHQSGTFMNFNVYLNHLNESPMEILSSTCSSMDQ